MKSLAGAALVVFGCMAVPADAAGGGFPDGPRGRGWIGRGQAGREIAAMRAKTATTSSAQGQLDGIRSRRRCPEPAGGRLKSSAGSKCDVSRHRGRPNPLDVGLASLVSAGGPGAYGVLPTSTPPRPTQSLSRPSTSPKGSCGRPCSSRFCTGTEHWNDAPSFFSTGHGEGLPMMPVLLQN